jgi:hypothetical protein
MKDFLSKFMMLLAFLILRSGTAVLSAVALTTAVTALSCALAGQGWLQPAMIATIITSVLTCIAWIAIALTMQFRWLR